MRTVLVMLVVLFSSCYENKSCEPNYIGTFYIDTNLVKDVVVKSFVSKYRWDTVALVSTANGNYRFNVADGILKQSEGTWYTKSNNIEGECFGFIRQLNLQEAIILYQFDITVFANDSTKFRLPFRKRNKMPE